MKNRNRNLIKIGIVSPFFVLFLFALKLNFRISAISHASTNIDTIAVQIIPNPNHDSPQEWCKKHGRNAVGKAKKNKEMKIDGYESIKIGRTTYVNVSNVSGTELKTYIYLISYSQNADSDTIKIYNKLLDHWHFNINLSTIGECSISNKYCDENDDCLDDKYECVANPSSQSIRKFCQLKESENCLIDEDCSEDLFCDSDKAKVIRDTKRFADMSFMQSAVDNYEKFYGVYPSLKAGTYIASTSISTWASWGNEFSDVLGVKLQSDPLNIMGECIAGCGSASNFNPETCWDENEKWFSDADCSTPIALPLGSYAYFWHDKTLCANKESLFIIPSDISICQ